ncbi:Flp family type IVb pilin [Aquipuribacter sp. SD81]|uniref:Flp family type IVb pilin n=1 Tax=Aquipuribacter sp. SD81 TaxID=3127703 RepID=UPI0030164B10
MRRVWKSDEGATAVEYGLIIAAIAAAIVVAVIGLGTFVSNNLFSVGCETMNAAQATNTDCTP